MTGSGGANKLKYTGHERDAESGLDHTLYRQLSSAQGRWLSPDSVRGTPSNPQSLNRYAYGGNNPANRIDPDGAQDGIPCPTGTVPNPDFRSGGARCNPLEPLPQPLSFLDEDDWGVIYSEPFTIHSLLDDVIYDIIAGMDDDCARAVARDANMNTDAFFERMSKVTFKIEWLGYPRGKTFGDDGRILTFERDPALAEWFGNTITINAAINWLNPSNVNAIGQDGRGQRYDLGAALQDQFQASSPLNKHQVLAHTILHELGHEFAGIFRGHGDVDSLAYNKNIWDACQNIFGAYGP